MVATQKKYEVLSTKKGFNDSLMHFRAVSSILGDFEDQNNLADLVADLIYDETIQTEQTAAIVHALLADKYGYFYYSLNLTKNLENFDTLVAETKKWKAVDIVLAYSHPELGLTLINPKNKESFETLNTLKKDELMVAYFGAFGGELDAKIAKAAFAALKSLLSGGTKKSPESLLKGKFTFKKAIKQEEKVAEPVSAPARSYEKKPLSESEPQTAEPAEQASEKPAKKAPAAAPAPKASEGPSGPKRMTPMYSVNVTNELFHNGNVEAWKRIIQSYTASHPGCEVYVFYDGERIHDINTLFKWGKVKHGSSILFAVAGVEIKNVAKLQRYLQQGASHRFEDFLKFPVDQVINLF